MRKLCRVGFMSLLVTTLSFTLYGQNYFFAETKESEILTTTGGKRVIIPEKYKSVVLDINGIQSFFKSVPSETNNNLNAREQAAIIELPMPDGGRAKYRIWESPVMEPALASRFTTIKTYGSRWIINSLARIGFNGGETGC